MGIFNRKKAGNSSDSQKIAAFINEYGEVMEKVSNEAVTKYPANVFPKSLLPCAKEQIENVLNEAILHCSDKGMAEQLKIGLVFLRDFIDDEEANRKNKEMLDIYNKYVPNI